jgi:hypothetical protein
MTRRHITLGTGAVFLAASAGATAGIAGAQSVGPPAASDPTFPAVTPDLGVGERLLLVIGGSYPTREEAVTANEGMPFGDIQGYYVARTDQFEGLRTTLEKPGDDYVLVTAFRTEAGALEFLALAEAAENPASITDRLVNKGYEYVGLGQEADPDGSGPLDHPIQGVTTG